LFVEVLLRSHLEPLATIVPIVFLDRVDRRAQSDLIYSGGFNHAAVLTDRARLVEFCDCSYSLGHREGAGPNMPEFP
jgi:hypothetical protein